MLGLFAGLTLFTACGGKENITPTRSIPPTSTRVAEQLSVATTLPTVSVTPSTDVDLKSTVQALETVNSGLLQTQTALKSPSPTTIPETSTPTSIPTLTPTTTPEPTPTLTPTPLPSDLKTGLLIPLYIYPGDTWNRVIQLKKSYQNLDIVVIINPNSGPGDARNPDYITWIKRLRDDGITVIGYVHTRWGDRPSDEVEREIGLYRDFYPELNGIFFDQMANQPGTESYYEQAADYAQSKSLAFIVNNPGTRVPSSHIEIGNNIVIREDEGLPDPEEFCRHSYPREKVGLLAHGVKKIESYVEKVKHCVGWLFVTDDVMPNPWDKLPVYFEDMGRDLSQ